LPIAEILDIGGFKDPTFDTNLIEKLVMKQDRRDLIKALSKSYVREDSAGNQATKSAWTADFIQGKGKGQIFLLHGGPGVGKTCTAGMILPTCGTDGNAKLCLQSALLNIQDGHCYL
jgi:hypothetical protein